MQRISFAPAMLKAVLSGMKTVTRRRFMADLPMQQEPSRYRCLEVTEHGASFEDLHTLPPTLLGAIPCPIGKAGDIVEVQENLALQLQVIRVRAEQIREFTEADAHAEGIGRRKVRGVQQWGGVEPNSAVPGSYFWNPTPVEAFQGLLNSLYLTAWARNEWVWVVEFRLLSPL